MESLFFAELFQDPRRYVLTVLVIVFSICVHEWCHARVALSLGDDTACRLGFMSLNPLKVMGWQSLIVLLFLGFAYGRVPVNQERLRGRFGGAIVSIAGPLANLCLACAFLLLLRVFETVNFPLMHELLGTLVYLNVLLFVFNLLPVPPLDGWGVLESLCPQVGRKVNGEMRGVMFFLLFGLLMTTWGREALQVTVKSVCQVLAKVCVK